MLALEQAETDMQMTLSSDNRYGGIMMSIAKHDCDDALNTVQVAPHADI